MLKQFAQLVRTPVTVLTVSWFLLLWSAAISAQSLVPYDPSFPHADIYLATSGLPKAVYSWANFDGIHYLSIAQEGYLKLGLVQAFFPVFPILLSIGSFFRLPPLQFGLFLNSFLAILFLQFWYRYLVRVTQSKIVSLWTVLVFLSFPTSFFLLAVYTESLFLLLVIVIFNFMEQRKWMHAALLIGLATATKVVGIFLVPATVFYLLTDKQAYSRLTYREIMRNIRQQWKSVLLLTAVGSAGLVGYMLYLNKYFSDPFYFFHVQAEFGVGRQESLVLLPQVFYRYIRILSTYRPFGLVYFASAQEFFLTILISVALIAAWKKKIVPLYQILFSIACLLLPTLTGTLTSMPRYVLVALPAFTAIGWLLQSKPALKPWYIVTSTFFLVCNTILFIQGYWIA